jgi:hypothetical protein
MNNNEDYTGLSDERKMEKDEVRLGNYPNKSYGTRLDLGPTMLLLFYNFFLLYYQICSFVFKIIKVQKLIYPVH